MKFEELLDRRQAGQLNQDDAARVLDVWCGPSGAERGVAVRQKATTAFRTDGLPRFGQPDLGGHGAGSAGAVRREALLQRAMARQSG